MKTKSSLAQVIPKAQHRYRMLAFFGRTLERFTSWWLGSGFSPLTAQAHLAGLKRLEPWFLNRPKQRPEDLSVHDIGSTYRFYRKREPFSARAILAFGDFLQATDCLKPVPALRRIKPRAFLQYLDLPIFGDFVADFAAWSLACGYPVRTTANHLDTIRWLVPWFHRRGRRSIGDLTVDDISEAWRFCQKRRPFSAGAVRALGEMLKAQGRLRPGRPAPPTKSQAEIARFAEHLRTNLALAAETVYRHCLCLRRFLEFLRFDEGKTALNRLQLADVHRFIGWMARHYCRRSMPLVVGTARVFLRFKFMEGVLREPLHLWLDSVQGYRGERLPHPLPWSELQKLLRSMDRSTPIGARDFTILLLAASYGLRRSEVAALTLDDIDWRARTLRINQIKTRQGLLLPLTDEIANALVDYLRHGRRATTCRQLFLRQPAPVRPLKATAVYHSLERAIRATRVAIKTTRFHALRHAFALRLLRQGTALSHISQVMGHRDLNSTSEYLRLDVEDLRQVALPAPRLSRNSGVKFGSHPKPSDSLSPVRRMRPMGSVTAPAWNGFRSFLSKPMEDFLALQRALGRKYEAQGWILRNLDRFLWERHPKGCAFTATMFDGWAAAEAATVSPTTRCHRMRLVRKFCVYLGRVAPNTFIPDSLSFPKEQPYQAPCLLSEDDVARLALAAVQKPRPTRTPEHPLRPHTMRLAILLLYCCGLRRGELLKLRLADMDSEQQVLRINQTKFNKSRLIPLSPSVGTELRKYLQLRLDHKTPMEPSAPLLWSGRPNRIGGAFSGTGLRFNWNQICRYAGVLNQRGRPPRIHDLRHSFAVAVLQRAYHTGDPQAALPRLARYMGHLGFQFTHHYLHLTQSVGVSANDRFRRFLAAAVSPQKGGAL
jgi:integrase/recombinase XerD